MPDDNRDCADSLVERMEDMIVEGEEAVKKKWEAKEAELNMLRGKVKQYDEWMSNETKNEKQGKGLDKNNNKDKNTTDGEESKELEKEEIQKKRKRAGVHQSERDAIFWKAEYYKLRKMVKEGHENEDEGLLSNTGGSGQGTSTGGKYSVSGSSHGYGERGDGGYQRVGQYQGNSGRGYQGDSGQGYRGGKGRGYQGGSGRGYRGGSGRGYRGGKKGKGGKWDKKDKGQGNRKENKTHEKETKLAIINIFAENVRKREY